MQTVRMNSRNQIVLPREVRDAMQLKGCDELLVVVKGNVTVIMPKPESHRRALAGSGKKIYGEAYLGRERKTW